MLGAEDPMFLVTGGGMSREDALDDVAMPHLAAANDEADLVLAGGPLDAPRWISSGTVLRPSRREIHLFSARDKAAA